MGDQAPRLLAKGDAPRAGSLDSSLSRDCPARHRDREHPDRQLRPRPRTRHQPGDAGGAARSGDVGRGVGHGLRPAREAHRRAPHHAGVREHAPHGGARLAPPRRTARRRKRRGAPRQPFQGNPLRRRAAPQGGQAQGDGGHRLARARHRHRRRGAGVPARHAAQHLGLPAARRPRQSLGGRRAERPHLPEQPRRADRLRGAARFRAPRRARPPAHSRTSARRALAADRRRSLGARIRRGRALRARAQRVSVPQSRAQGFRRRGAHARRGHRHQARPPRHLSASRRGQPACCARARARGSRPSPAAAPSPTTPTTR